MNYRIIVWLFFSFFLVYPPELWPAKRIDASGAVLSDAYTKDHFDLYIPESRKTVKDNSGFYSSCLKVFLPSNAIDPSRMNLFFLRYGIEVEVTVYRDNAEFSKMLEPVNGALRYDVIILPGEKLPYLCDSGLLMGLRDLDFYNMGTLMNRFLFLGYHKGQRYGVPISWRVYGLLVNESLITGNDAQNVGLDNLFKPLKYHYSIVLPDNPRLCLGMALSMLGYSYNSIDRNQLTQAASLIANAMNSPKFLGLAEVEKGAKMCSNNFLAMTIASSQAARRAVKKNSRLTFLTPKTGVPAEVFFASISAQTQKRNASILLVDFLLDPHVSARNASYTGLSTTNAEAIKIFSAQNPGQINLICPQKMALEANLEFISDASGEELIFNKYWQDLLTDSPLESY